MKGKYIAIATVIVGLTAAGTCAVGNMDYSNGSRTGTVVKISRKGFKGFKTWEGQLALGGATRQGPSAGTNLWDFSIDSLMDDAKEEELVGKLKGAMDEGTPVVVDYDEKYFQFDVRGDTKYFVTDMRPQGKKKP